MARGCRGVTDHHDVFLSYSRNDREAAINLRSQLQQSGLYVFKDDERIRAGSRKMLSVQGILAGRRAVAAAGTALAEQAARLRRYVCR